MHRLQHLSRLGSIMFVALLLVSLAACDAPATPVPQPSPPVSNAGLTNAPEPLVAPTQIVVEASKTPAPTAASVPTQAPEPSGSQSLIGTWERITSEDKAGLFFAFAERIEFLKDGTFVLPRSMNQSGKYSFLESDRIKFEGSSGAAVYKFALSGNSLVFQEGDQSIEYRRTEDTKAPRASSSGSQSLLGIWERVTSEDQAGLFFTFAEQIEFLKDGTFILPKYMNQSGKYSFPENDRIKFEGSSGAAVYRFAVSGDTLMFQEGDQTIEYRRMK
ncbi:hypothetical protein [Candidatus Amarolinea aalborgensis]|uniref:hypothetical protein n=1 Tax=Candidatus Amarolinea aalborgensis TaxID=2249329 RepID=UPI003BF94496